MGQHERPGAQWKQSEPTQARRRHHEPSNVTPDKHQAAAEAKIAMETCWANMSSQVTPGNIKGNHGLSCGSRGSQELHGNMRSQQKLPGDTRKHQRQPRAVMWQHGKARAQWKHAEPTAAPLRHQETSRAIMDCHGAAARAKRCQWRHGSLMLKFRKFRPSTHNIENAEGF